MEPYTDGGRIIKMEVDYSNTVDEKLPMCEKLASEGKLNEALEILLALEKQTRTGADTHSTSRVLVKIVQLCYQTESWNALNENIVYLCKRRSQIKQAICRMIQECCTYVDLLPDGPIKLGLIDTLRSVTEGKIYVEVERARLTHKLALIKEKEGNIDEAAVILQDLQIETFGSMDRKEKVELILEQMRLCLLKKDFIRTQIISKKIATKFFEDPEQASLRLKYYKLMIQLDKNNNSYLAISKHYRAIYKTASLSNEEKLSALRHMILYLLLAPFDNEQSDMLQHVRYDREIENIPIYQGLISLFTTQEIIPWSELLAFYDKGLHGPEAETDVFMDGDAGKRRWEDLKTRAVEHNIRILAKYYSRIYIARVAEFLNLGAEQTEEALSRLVSGKVVTAKMDRMAGIVFFSQHKDPTTLLQDWSHNIDALMDLVGKATHLINKEEMVHKHLHVASATTA